MRLDRITVSNYRSLTDLDLAFPSFYTAICGKNDAGKTNVIRALRAVMEQENPYGMWYSQELSLKDDFPKWATNGASEKRITIGIEVTVDRGADAGLFEFLLAHLGIASEVGELRLTLTVSCCSDEDEPEVRATVLGTDYDGLKAQEVLKKLQNSHAILFYNSTELDPRNRFGRGLGGFLTELSGDYARQIDEVIGSVNKRLRKVAKGQQEQFTQLLGRLETKYKAGLSVPPFDIDWLPFNLSLADGRVSVGLSEWGSGTRNRTLVLLTLFRAKEISKSNISASKITPVIVVEEPESFLHPSAQAEFGRILQDLAQEFRVQVITTTHSPHMLSLENAESNVLLERRVSYGQLRETVRVDTGGDDWMRPYGEALGVTSEDFRPWYDLFFSRSRSILLVEGDMDKEYFELLRGKEHGEDRLQLDGEVFSYGGFDTLKQGVLLHFIKERYPKMVITYDLDVARLVGPKLDQLGLVLNADHFPLGVDVPGKRDIEGLLPDGVKAAVHAASPGLVEQLRSDKKEERDAADRKLKRLYLEEFRHRAVPGHEYFGEFYKVVKRMNRAFNAE